MLKFILPNFFENKILNKALVELHDLYPDIFKYDNMCFVYLEGAYPYFYWSYSNNNNLKNTPVTTREDISYFYGFKASVLLDCSNDLLLPSDLNDIKSNYVLSTMNNGSNAISVGTPMMIEYLTDKYPEYYLIGNINYQFNDPTKEYLHNLKYIKQDRLDLNNEWYQDIPKSKIFYGLITMCKNCPNYWICRTQNETNRCMFSEKNCITECSKTNYNLVSDEEFSDLIKQGYQNFYFDAEGLNPMNTLGFMDMYIQFFIKPEDILFAVDWFKQKVWSV